MGREVVVFFAAASFFAASATEPKETGELTDRCAGFSFSRKEGIGGGSGGAAGGETGGAATGTGGGGGAETGGGGGGATGGGVARAEADSLADNGEGEGVDFTPGTGRVGLRVEDIGGGSGGRVEGFGGTVAEKE